MISGLTKAWIGTQNSGTKEVSFNGHTHSGYALSNHTHTASQITDLSSSNIVYYSYTKSTYGNMYFTVPTPFTPKMVLMYYGTSSSTYSANVWFASRDTMTNSNNSMAAVHLTSNTLSAGISVSIGFNNDSVYISNISSNGTFDCLVFG